VLLPAPNTQPERKDVKHASTEAWIASFVKSGSWRATRRSLPLLWLVLVGAFVFPMGLWNPSGVVSQADEIQSEGSKSSANAAAGDSAKSEAATNEEVVKDEASTQTAPSTTATTESNEPDANAALPDLPSPELPPAPSTPVSAPATETLYVKVIESGRILDSEVARGATVRDAIEACGLQLNNLDRIYPTPGTPAYNGQKIRITRVRAVTKSYTVTVDPDVRYQLTTDLRPGHSKVVQWGRSGLIELAERIWFKDGVVSGREKLARKIVRPTQDKIVALGARAQYMPGQVPYHNRYARAYRLASRSGSPRDRIESRQTGTLRAVRSVTLVATGYSPDPRENGGWSHTATGLPIGYGAAAVDPRVIPLGTKLYIEGYGYAFACDTGGAIKGHRIDLAYDSYGAANSKGRRKVRAWILAP
jgi:3D (Asp-Asp-Asp) domain-containing protein